MPAFGVYPSVSTKGPSYPVIVRDPSIGTTLKNMKVTEWGTILGFTALGGVWGFTGGESQP